VARGIYSAIGWWPGSELPAALAALDELTGRINAGEPVTEPAAVHEAIEAIRAFETVVGEPCGIEAGRVATPDGPAIELGNVGHKAFGAEHEHAARVVAIRLQAVLDAFGATRTMWFTLD